MPDINKETKAKFEQVLTSLEQDLKSIHTGRAHPGVVEDIKVNHYNSVLPLKQLASISAASAHEIVITPWDPGALQPIETALREAGRNFNPQNDGTVIRISLPPLSGERRQELIKLVTRQAEQARIGLRTIRDQVWRQVKQAQKDGALTEDDRYRLERELNDLIADFNKQVEQLTERKRQAIEA